MSLSKGFLIGLWVFLVIGSALDVVFTFNLLKVDMGKEANIVFLPVMRHGPGPILLIKMLPLVILGAIIFMGKKLLAYEKFLLDTGTLIAATAMLIILSLHAYSFLALWLLK